MITLKQVLDILKQDNNFRSINSQENYSWNWKENPTFSKLSYDSRQTDSQTLFFAKGQQFKKAFLTQAVQNGLTFYISEIDYGVDIPVILVNCVKQAMSLVAMAFYDNPQEKLKLLAFTGTKGKTTAAYFAYSILSQEFPTAMLSTMNTTLDGKTFFKSTLSTPESLDLMRMMAEAVQNGMTHLVMEVSSQAYLVKRVYGLIFDVGVFLNISPDHIGPIEHPTFEDYFYHKRQLLANSRAVVINSQMMHFELIKEQVENQDYDFYGANSDNQIINSQAFSFELRGKLTGSYDCQLLGEFNQENALAAGLACLRLRASQAAIQTGIAKAHVPGRMEVLTQTNGAKVFVDYAHNQDSLTKLIQVVKAYQKGKIILILGAPGNKGESRRADFAQVINDYSDLIVILTADDPNFEDPLAICQEIAKPITRAVDMIIDREEAIKQALSLTTGEEDAVIIAGKGADAFQIVKGERMAYAGDLALAKKYR
ncbi:UDP-N-acetylmuramoyl-L-alanyl-D-glutamate--L-lysine ligase [Streptococcus sp. sy018]|uniref:UDP-N-acetylmuramoyl-L-alanyl-D-glutamate--L- lysine ligase n=1 Tax=Streptococcus sp. sy018 TaxID=2600147 RepID=UPI0011B7B5BC|nr:UDP-N-acetylmuramoyl-L-alanyl-D-glutamate--L-lysine ligase [Streptococcus sp. sy018]TWS94671.1 UDP-N-acetylmuramoyl-L-alanyl-D-glutamate--L-lysine ligase [Streptococcus sp. sy018]